ncbi:E3 ubiquitin-protein ligase TRIM39-like [Xyrauchen texanus]|uniref:E3 ubiquitin-protein ligase TRIM39-like n=1 Tax=Xyrauchen texanus TaxID=154827 RepID=UPI0022428902|nr:E3 ubiquitin-protein ligase TRIM39-like [Xyrauchen texanus]
MAEFSQPPVDRRSSMTEPIELKSPKNPLIQCSICLDVLTDPVTTPCGHNYCKTCLTKCWDKNRDCRCPLCKENFPKRPNLKINTALRELAESYRRKKTKVLCYTCAEKKVKALKSCLECQTSYCETHLEPHQKVSNLMKHKLIDPVENLEDYICQKHEKPLELFCRDDQISVCLSCTEEDHKTHNTVPIEDEITEKKSQLASTQMDVRQMIQDRQKNILNMKESITLSNESRTELHQVMENQKAAEKQVEELIKELEQEITELTRRNSELELTHHYLKMMQEYAVDVTLDPNTAHACLILSEDGKQVKVDFSGNNEHDLPNNPERFDTCPSVLGKEGFSSGKFYFEVQVEGKTDWDLGVANGSIKRKGEIKLSPKNGFWTVGLWKGNEYQASASPSVSLSLREKPQKVGVFVDYEEGLVSFFDVDSNSHIYSFTGQSFTGNLYPYFYPGKNNEDKMPLILMKINCF